MYTWPKLQKTKHFCCQIQMHINTFPQTSSHYSEKWWEFCCLFHMLRGYPIRTEVNFMLKSYRYSSKNSRCNSKKLLGKEIEGTNYIQLLLLQESMPNISSGLSQKYDKYVEYWALYERKEKQRQKTIFTYVFRKRK